MFKFKIFKNPDKAKEKTEKITFSIIIYNKRLKSYYIFIKD